MFQLPPCSEDIKNSPEYKAASSIIDSNFNFALIFQAFGPARAVDIAYCQISGVACVSAHSSYLSKCLYFNDLASDFGAMARALKYGLQS